MVYRVGNSIIVHGDPRGMLPSAPLAPHWHNRHENVQYKLENKINALPCIVTVNSVDTCLPYSRILCNLGEEKSVQEIHLYLSAQETEPCKLQGEKVRQYLQAGAPSSNFIKWGTIFMDAIFSITCYCT